MRLPMTILALSLALAGAARADILIVQNQGNTPVPVEETSVSMDYESVEIDVAKSYQVEAVFHMRSHADAPLKRKMAFPVTAVRYAHYMKRSFQVWSKAKGEPDSAYQSVPVSLSMKKTEATWADEFYADPDLGELDYPGYVTWEVSWKPKETRVFRVIYDMGVPASFQGIVDGWRLTYVVRTGALWKGPIGEADVTIRFDSDVRNHRIATTPLVVSHADRARWVSDREIRWHFEDWEPKRDIQVASYAWVGLTEENIERFFLALPHPYQGADKTYTEAMLDALVERKIAPWKEVFPERCARLDRELIRTLVAGWLYHEIFARHGDPFLVGEDDGGKWPKEAVMGMDGYLYGRWHDKFRAYMYHGGWYSPKYGPEGKVSLDDLSPVERKNAEFLRKYL
jgi:hypothetical protein